jgi:hypothetical protein
VEPSDPGGDRNKANPLSKTSMIFRSDPIRHLIYFPFRNFLLLLLSLCRLGGPSIEATAEH